MVVSVRGPIGRHDRGRVHLFEYDRPWTLIAGSERQSLEHRGFDETGAAKPYRTAPDFSCTTRLTWLLARQFRTTRDRDKPYRDGFDIAAFKGISEPGLMKPMELVHRAR